MNTAESFVIKGKHIAITGILTFYKREDAFEQIRSRGGIPQENVTKETDYLVVGHYRKNTIINGKSVMKCPLSRVKMSVQQSIS